jgi:hypothetical protein
MASRLSDSEIEVFGQGSQHAWRFDEGLSRQMLNLAAAKYGWKDLPFDGRLDCGPAEDAYYNRLAREVYRQLTSVEIESLRRDSRPALEEGPAPKQQVP